MEEIRNIQSLFDTHSRKFRIPAYQRSYSWEEKQIRQLIEDLKSVEDRYYLGHFLFEKSEEENTFLIIDGQQRLTTCVIFFRCILDELNKRQDCTIDLDDIEDYYVKNLRKKTPKFETVEQDNNFFSDVIVEGRDRTPETRSQERILQAKKIFAKEFSDKDTATLEQWCHLIENASITQFIVNDKIQAAQIFAFQNDRGKALTKLEIVKSFFMLQIYLSAENNELATAHIQYIEREFAKIYGEIVRIDTREDDVLSYYWRAVSGQGYFASDIIEGVKETLVRQTDKIAWIKNFVSNLSIAFRAVENIEKSDVEAIVDLRYLNNMALSLPFFIKAKIADVDGKTLSRLARFLENITFRSLIRGGRADIHSRLNDFLKKACSDETFNRGIDERLNNYFRYNEWWNYWSDHELENHLNSGWFYGNRVDNYLLWKYELYLCNENHPRPHKVDFSDLIRNESIEHIAPQTPTNGDPVANGYGEYEGENGIGSGGWLNCVGNLMLISRSHNSSIGNKPFAEKLASYGRDNLLNQQREIVEFVSDPGNPVWDVAAIKRRHDKILAAAKAIWSWDKI